MPEPKFQQPSSSTAGFFQAFPILPAAFTAEASQATHQTGSTSDDVALARILNLYIPQGSFAVYKSIHDLSRRALHPSVLEHGIDAELNTPRLRPLNTFGQENSVDPLWVTEGWKSLKAIGQQEGLVTSGYDEAAGWNRRVHQFGLNHVWSSSAAMTGCPASMTDGAAKLIHSHLKDEDGDQPGRSDVLRQAYSRLISRDPAFAWTSGQWMTERSGGSSVSETETIARRLTDGECLHAISVGKDRDAHGMPLGPWRIDGFKWFSSATDSDMALLLARTEQGLSLFYIPLRRRAGPSDSHGSILNGVRIQRLKNKVGTKQLPTAELELKGTRGWLIGQPGKGVREIATILNITRLYTAGGSAAGWGRGLAVCRAYSKSRIVQGKLLEHNHLHVRWMAGETVKYRAAMNLTFFGLALQGAVEQGWDKVVQNTRADSLIPKDKKSAFALLRLITPVLKSQVSVNAVEGLRACMEGLGGVGYCENNEDGGILNIAKIFRDTLVNPIWEGTVSVMAEDVVRVLSDSRLGDGHIIDGILSDWVKTNLSRCKSRFPHESEIVRRRLDALVSLVQSTDKNELLWRGRELLIHLEAIVSSVVLMYDACSDGDEVSTEVASRYASSKALPGEALLREGSWHKEALMDQRIFLGTSSRVSAGKL
ncbi:hypothetical protein VI817_005295 [Penicillium citrinum]|uniref:Acyl-CoA dehydrogenase n=1 Tax=Penicillium hetheringtonii TaxID=911720 RepID=A0AAD6GPH6_9EURO|nr:hypothetical protein N7450_008610 [Penicillium hetheringtonii]KAK5796010.1 hypothetical protein VI817_005295 [Penicillium citrinum]